MVIFLVTCSYLLCECHLVIVIAELISANETKLPLKIVADVAEFLERRSMALL